jgi:hypothetical protein
MKNTTRHGFLLGKEFTGPFLPERTPPEGFYSVEQLCLYSEHIPTTDPEELERERQAIHALGLRQKALIAQSRAYQQKAQSV